MKTWISARSVLRVSLTSLAALLAAAGQAGAQQGQGEYITQASARLTKLVDKSNQQGYVLQNNSFSIGGGWLKQSPTSWIPIYSLKLNANTTYRFLGAGDNDARDVDLQVLDSTGKIVAADEDTAAEAAVQFTPGTSGTYTVRLRLFASRENLPCVCMGIVMVKK